VATWIRFYLQLTCHAFKPDQKAQVKPHHLSLQTNNSAARNLGPVFQPVFERLHKGVGVRSVDQAVIESQ
jgi:hypothetical protein